MATANGEDMDYPRQKIFTLNVFETLDRTQNLHGVMHEDYHQYHQYCTNRLYRLRHNKAVRRDLVHSSKYVEGVQRRRNAYCPRNLKSKKKQENNEFEGNEVTEDDEETQPPTTPALIEHENHIWLPLYQAERAWAQACEVQKQKRPTKSQQLVCRKLRKALKFVATVEELSLSACDETTQREIQSYAKWMKGNYCLQKQDYTAALEAYRSSMSLLLTLAQELQQTSQDDPKSLVLADLWTTRAESVLRPLVRFCQYECKDTSYDVTLEETAASSKARESSEIIIHFRGKDLPLDAYKELCVLHLKAEALQKQLQEGTGNESLFLSLLSIYDDSIAVIEEEMKKYQSIQAGPAVNAKKEELGFFEGYFQYQKLVKSLQKNQERLEDCHSDAERVHVYDALLQNAQSMAQISAGGSGSGSGPEEEEAQAHVLRIRSFRCFEMSKVYLTSLRQPAQAKTLCQHTKTLAKRAIEELAACDTRDKYHEDEMEAYLQELEKLAKVDLPVLDVRIKAAQYLAKTGNTGGFTTGTDRPLWMRLEEFDPGMTGAPLVDSPPMPIPIPCKPVFYDIAWRYAGGQFPIEELEAEIALREPRKSGGIFGWLSGK